MPILIGCHQISFHLIHSLKCNVRTTSLVQIWFLNLLSPPSIESDPHCLFGRALAACCRCSNLIWQNVTLGPFYLLTAFIEGLFSAYWIKGIKQAPTNFHFSMVEARYSCSTGIDRILSNAPTRLALWFETLCLVWVEERGKRTVVKCLCFKMTWLFRTVVWTPLIKRVLLPISGGLKAGRAYVPLRWRMRYV